jgi:DNA repair exonuclease SbcCD nuclease subunit
MKIGFIADVHIKLGQKNVPVEWAKARFALLLVKMQELECQIDKWIIGGDVFDRHPTVEEMEVYFNLVRGLNKPTWLYAGNHEASKKDTTFLSNLKNVTSWVNPLVTIIDDYHTEDGIDFIPYNRLKHFEKNGFPTPPSPILVSHFRGEIPPHVKPEIDLDLFNSWEIVLAGDLHGHENSQRNIVYPGSPLTTSFHRSRVHSGVVIVDTSTLAYAFVALGLPQLIKKTLQAGETPVATEYDHTIYDLEGDMAELSGLEDNDLIDKKIIKRSTDTALMLDAEATLEEEVVEYLRYILEVNETAVEAVLKELSNNAIKE